LDKSDEDEDDSDGEAEEEYDSGGEDENEGQSDGEVEDEFEAEVGQVGDGDQGLAEEDEMQDPHLADESANGDTANEGSGDAVLSSVTAHGDSVPRVSRADAKQQKLEQMELEYPKVELTRLDAQRLNGSNPDWYLDTEYPFPDPDEDALPADHPVANMSIRELMELDD